MKIKISLFILAVYATRNLSTASHTGVSEKANQKVKARSVIWVFADCKCNKIRNILLIAMKRKPDGSGRGPEVTRRLYIFRATAQLQVMLV